MKHKITDITLKKTHTQTHTHTKSIRCNRTARNPWNIPSWLFSAKVIRIKYRNELKSKEEIIKENNIRKTSRISDTGLHRDK